MTTPMIHPVADESDRCGLCWKLFSILSAIAVSEGYAAPRLCGWGETCGKDRSSLARQAGGGRGTIIRSMPGSLEMVSGRDSRVSSPSIVA